MVEKEVKCILEGKNIEFLALAKEFKCILEGKNTNLKKPRYIFWGRGVLTLSFVGLGLYAFRNQLTYFGPVANWLGSLFKG